MSEKFNRNANERENRLNILNKVYTFLQERYGDNAFLHFDEEVLALAKTKVSFEDDFSTESLTNGPLIIFSNHPSFLDIAIVIKGLRDKKNVLRTDFKLLFNEENMERAVRYFTQRFFIAANRGKQMIPNLDEAVETVNSGGVFIIFPFDIDKERKNGKLDMQSGLPYVLSKVRVDTRLIGVNIGGSKQGQTLKSIMEKFNTTSLPEAESLGDPSQTQNLIVPRKEFRLEDFQKIISYTGMDTVSERQQTRQLLTAAYESKFA